jgi:hypothetical protein
MVTYPNSSIDIGNNTNLEISPKLTLVHRMTLIRKIHYNVMPFKDTMTADEADALAGRATDKERI